MEFDIPNVSGMVVRNRRPVQEFSVTPTTALIPAVLRRREICQWSLSERVPGRRKNRWLNYQMKPLKFFSSWSFRLLILVIIYTEYSVVLRVLSRAEGRDQPVAGLLKTC